MSKLIRNATLVNEGQTFEADVLIKNGMIHTVGKNLNLVADETIDARGLHLLPGVIDDQVHFREPGLTHKADIQTESRSAAAGGITTYMEMPNTSPSTTTIELLEQKFARAAQVSPVNYSFYLGATPDNLEEIKRVDGRKVCGIKIFMGSSTGSLLVDDEEALERIFGGTPLLIATHCEDEATIRKNMAAAKERFGQDVPFAEHPNIRSAEACYLSSSRAIALAKRFGSRLHILHISTERETHLFDNQTPLSKKKITSEACVHHLWYSSEDYAEKGTWIKWNPAVKTPADRDGIWQAVLDDRIDVIATDHAPHTLAEKQEGYFSAPSGGPLAQHSLVAMLECVRNGRFDLPTLVRKMCHAPADCFQIDKRGYIREGYFADLVLVDLNRPWTVNRQNVLSKCGWSPFEGQTFNAQVTHTFVNGELAYCDGRIDENVKGKRVEFARE